MDNLLKAIDVSSLEKTRRCHRKEVSRVVDSFISDEPHDSGHCRKVIGLGRNTHPCHDRKACRAVVLPGDWDPSSYPHPMCRAHDSPSRQIGPLHEQQRKLRKRAPICSLNTERRRLTHAGGSLCNNRGYYCLFLGIALWAAGEWGVAWLKLSSFHKAGTGSHEYMRALSLGVALPSHSIRSSSPHLLPLRPASHLSNWHTSSRAPSIVVASSICVPGLRMMNLFLCSFVRM